MDDPEVGYLPEDSRPAEYGSDVIVELLEEYGIEYVALNPGASFRGIHDSLVNRVSDHAPKIILSPHEETAVSIAHGYAKATGKPMAAICHNIVGLMHASMAIYNAFADRVPLLVLGGTGPMDSDKRRPWIDWIHTALIQGNIVREFVKWDDQPSSVNGIETSLARGYSIAVTEPQGPVYLCFDTEIQNSRAQITRRGKRNSQATRIDGGLETIPRIAESILSADCPIAVAGRVGRNHDAIGSLVDLADVCALGVLDSLERFNFPSTHSMDITGTKLLESADFILSLDSRNTMASAHLCNVRMNLKDDDAVKRIREDSKIVGIGLDHLFTRSLASEFQEFEKREMTLTTDTSLFLPQLVKYCRKAVNENASYRRSVEERAARVKEAHDRAHEKWVDLARRSSSDTSITTADLASKIWSSIRDRDWVLAHGTLNGWARKLWSWTRPYHYHGDSGGGGLGYSVGASIGVALAYRGSGKLVISTIGDGDFLMACNGLWTAAHEKIPLLFVIVNNQSYHNDFEHQRRTAMERGRPIENARIGVSLDDPPPDYSSLAESLGCEGIRVEEAKMLDDALQRSIECVTKKNKPALLDIIVK